MHDKDVVSAVLLILARRLGQERLDLWFGANTRLSLREGKLVVEAANRFSQNWLRSHYRQDVEAACQEAFGQATAVEFHIDESLGQQKPAARVEPACQAVAAAEAAVSCVRLHQAEEIVETTAQDPIGKAGWPGKTAEQSLPRRKFSTLEGFVVGGSNRVAHASAEMVAENLGSLNPLVIHGPTGCGKTHLLEGIWTAARNRGGQRGCNAVFLTAEQYTTYFIEALRGSGLPSFRRKYRGVDLLLIDDLQFLAGKKATLQELLHTFDVLRREGRQLVFSADRSPRELSELGQELTSRLASGMVCSIEAPDLSMRVGLVKQFASRRQLELSEESAQYVAAQISGGPREISGAVNRIDAVGRMHRRPIDLALVSDALAEMAHDSGRPVRLDDVQRAVCDVFGLSQDSLQSSRRSKNISTPRILAMWLARKHTRAGLEEIGRYFGRRSHSTVISAQKRVGDWIAQQSQLDLSSMRCKIDDAIRRVEERLRATG